MPYFYGEGMKLGDLSRSEIHHLVDEYIHNQRDRMITKRRLTDGITYEKLAEEFDMSVGQIKNIVYKSQDRLLKVVNHGE